MANVKKRFPLAVVFETVDRITAPMRQIQRRIVQTMAPLQARLGSISRGLGLPRVSKSMENLGARTVAAGRAAGVAARRFALLGASAVAASFAMLRSFARAGDTIAKTADRLGIGVEALQEYRYAADLAGVTQEEFDKSLAQMVRGIGQARAGVGPLVSELGRMSPSLLANIQATESTEEALSLLLEAIERVPDAAQRAALAQVAFGEGGRKMITLALQGRDALSRQREEAHLLGGVIGDEAARESERFVDAQTRLGRALTGVRNTIAAKLLPAITPLVERLAAFLVDHLPQIEAFARAWAARLPGIIQDLRERFVELYGKLQPIIAIAQKIVAGLGPVRAVFLGLALVIGGKVLVALAALVPAILAVGTALLTTPIGWFLLGIAGIAAGAAVIIKYWEPISGFFKNLWGTVKGYFSDALGWITEQVQRVVALVPSGLRERLGLGGSTSTTAGTPPPSGPSGPGVGAPPPSGASGPPVNPPVLASRSEAKVVVEFANAPRGARVRTERDTGVDLDLDMGYALGAT